MKRTLRSFSLLFILSVAFLLTIVTFQSSAKAQDLSRSGIDYQKTADSADWGWVDSKAGPLWCISQSGDKYSIVMVSEPDDRDKITFKVLLGDKEVYSWRGHMRTVFRILENRLYYARFHPSGSGGSVVAVDLSTGKELWDSRLQGIGLVEHSAYRNLMILNANFEVVWVVGNETMGRYLEFKDVTMGKTVGHRIFPLPKQ